MSLPESVLEAKYDVVRQISEGGMGAVYLVRHRHLEELRVIKVIRRQHAQDEALQQRFLQEARTAIRLRHPKIAEIFDFSIGADGTAYIVMEHIDGKSLLQILRHGGPPPLPVTLELAVQTLEALDYLHRKGYVHRDISPDNVMLTRDFEDQPQIKLIDLGIAKRIDEDAGGRLTGTGTFLGKARYSPPEQFGKGEIDRRSDLYSFGVMVYELLTGQCPIAGETLSELISGHLFRPPTDFVHTDPDERVPAELRAIVLRALAKDPADRFPSAQDFAAALAPLRDAGDPDERKSLFEQALAAVADRPKVHMAPTLPLSRTPPVSGQAKTEVAVSVGVLTRQAAKVEELLERGDLEAARAKLDEVVAEFGQAALFRQLGAKLEQALAEREAIKRREEAARQKQIAEESERIRRLLADDQLEEADAALAKAIGLGPSEAWSELLAELEQALAKQRAIRERRIAELLKTAQERRRADELDDALAALSELLTMEPEHAGAQALRGEIEAAKKRAADRARKQQGLLTRIEWQLADGELDRAAEKLAQAQTAFDVGDPRLQILSERLEKARREGGAAQLAELHDRARQQRGEHAYEEAMITLRQALDIDPSEQTTHDLLIETENAYQAWIVAQAQESALRAAIGRIIERLDQDCLVEAREAHTQATGQLADHPELKRLGERLDALEHQHATEQKEQRAEIEQRVIDARYHLGSDELDEARALLRQVLDLEPAHTVAGQLLLDVTSEILRRRGEAQRADVLKKIATLLDQGQLAAVRHLLTAAERDFGTAAFRELRARLARADA